MGIRRSIRVNIIERLPKKYQLGIERAYCYPYMRKEIYIFNLFCNRNKISLDVGANKGNMTLFLSKLSSHVYCFEPVPWLCNYLKNRFAETNVSIENYALGDINGSMCLNIPLIDGKKIETRSSLLEGFQGKYILGKKIENMEKIEVEVRRIDDLCIDNIGFIKIDVEGYEIKVLEGAKETIKSDMPNILIEIEQRYHKEIDIIDIFNYILRFGYYGYFMDDSRLKSIDEFNVDIMQNPENDPGSKYINNFIFSAKAYSQG